MCLYFVDSIKMTAVSETTAENGMKDHKIGSLFSGRESIFQNGAQANFIVL